MLTWQEHSEALTWRQGEHTLLIGPTGSGKTTLAQALLPMRRHVIAFASKIRDPLLTEFRQAGYRTTSEWPTWFNEDEARLLIWPRIGTQPKRLWDELAKQRSVFRRVLTDAYVMGRWCLYIDETWYMTNYQRLSRELELLWLQGRSNLISVVAGAQRPRHLPVAAYSSTTHLYVWPTRDAADLKRLAEISGKVNPAEVAHALQTISDDHTCLYVHADGKMWATKAPQKG
jgi:energy-coupling factor transporter ATP-binding protein EcfA2